MKKILFFLSVLSCLYGSAQKTGTPTKPKVTGNIPKSTTKQNITEQSPTQTTVFNSPIISIPYKSPVTAPIAAQAKDHLLWFKGKKVNDSVLITTDAELVLYSKKRDMVVVQTDPKKDPWLKVIKKMEAVEHDKKQVVDAASGKPNSFFLYPHIVTTLKKIDQQNEEYSRALKNTIPLPEALPAVALRPFPAGGYASVRHLYTVVIPAGIKQAFDDVMQKRKSYPSLDFPPPPEDDFGACYQADGIANNQHYIDSYKWEQEFTKYESDLVKRSISIFKTIESLSLNADHEAIQIKAELDKVIEFAYARMKNKVALLIKNYGNDFTRLPSVIRMAISIERQKQLMGIGNDTSGDLMLQLAALLNGFDKYIEQQIAARNYDVVFNIAFMIGMERQKQLLGADEDKSTTSPDDILYRIFMPFNRFKIEMAVDYAVLCDDNGDGTCQFISETGTLATQKDFYISLFPYKYGGYQMVLRDVIYLPEHDDIGAGQFFVESTLNMRGKYAIELKTSAGNRKTTFIDDEGKEHVKTESYAGVETLTDLPISRIYFCKEREDTLYVGEFYNKAQRSLASPPHSELNLMFHSANLNDESVAKAASDADEYDKRRQSYEVEPTGFDKLNKQQNQFKIIEMYQTKAEYLLKNLVSKDAAILFDAENGDAEIMNQTVDVSGKVVETFKVNKGIMKVKIVHDPLPYVKKK